jgi:hypothetical protein
MTRQSSAQIVHHARRRVHAEALADDLIRAAEHMIELHGEKACAIARRRAEDACELTHVKRWRAIASAIEELEVRG